MKVDLQRWSPGTWDQVIGNALLKRHLKKLVATLRREYGRTGKVPVAGKMAMIITGQSRSGKTLLVKFLVRCLVCVDLDENLNPCQGTCETCSQAPEISGLEGLYAAIGIPDGQLPVNFRVVDCTKITTAAELKQELVETQASDGELTVVYFDEVHRLVKRGMDSMLLKEIEDKPILWVFSTAVPNELERMFLNRLVKFETELPDATEMAGWLCDRCDEGRIRWTKDAIKRLVAKSNRVPGLALQALALAAIDPDGLTLDLVENDWKLRVD